jgi:hypothetical protein
MKVSIVRADNSVCVDGAVRLVDLSGMDPSIRTVLWDDVRGEGEIDFMPEATYETEVRDHAGEDAEWAAARAARRKELEISVPIRMKLIQLPLAPRAVTKADMPAIAAAIERYRSLDPTPEQLAEQARQAQRSAKIAEIIAIENEGAGLRKLRDGLLEVLPEGSKSRAELLSAESAIEVKRRELAKL